MIHGITIRERTTKKLVEFIKCRVGRIALQVLSRARRNLGKDFKADEDYITEEEYKKMEDEKCL